VIRQKAEKEKECICNS